MADPQASATASTPVDKPEDKANAQEATQEEPKNSIREVFEALQRAAPHIKEKDPGLAERIATLTPPGVDPIRLNQLSFQHELAYVVQDFEKAIGKQVSLSDPTRTEVARLAGSAPGLENERMLALMRSTASISDAAVVRDIRRLGTEIGEQINQNSKNNQEKIEALENRVHLAQRRPDATPEAESRPAEDADAPAAGRPADKEQPNASPAAEAARRSAEATQQQAQTGLKSMQPTMLDAMLRGFRGPQSNGAPWDPLPTPFAVRLNAFQNAMRAGRDDIALRDAEKAARTALDALEGFRTGEGATVMSRINAAARSDPNGIVGVLSEMREGGRFEDLRRQFNTALADERGFAPAYDRAASALAEYGQARTGIEPIIARRPDAANLSAKFEQLDAELGQAAGNVPSRRDGKSMIDDIAKQAVEIVKRAVEAVRSVFSRNSPEASRPATSPSIG